MLFFVVISYVRQYNSGFPEVWWKSPEGTSLFGALISIFPNILSQFYGKIGKNSASNWENTTSDQNGHSRGILPIETASMCLVDVMSTKKLQKYASFCCLDFFWQRGAISIDNL